MPVSKSEFIAWRHNSVTQELLEDLLEQCDTSIAYLTTRAGLEPNHDRYLVGRIEGLRSLADWQPEFIDEEEADA